MGKIFYFKDLIFILFGKIRMDFFLQGLEQQIAEEKGQSKRHDSGIQEKWNGRKIPFEDRQKFAQYFEKSDLKNEGSLNGILSF